MGQFGAGPGIAVDPVTRNILVGDSDGYSVDIFALLPSNVPNAGSTPLSLTFTGVSVMHD